MTFFLIIINIIVQTRLEMEKKCKAQKVIGKRNAIINLIEKQ